MEVLGLAGVGLGFILTSNSNCNAIEKRRRNGHNSHSSSSELRLRRLRAGGNNDGSLSTKEWSFWRGFPVNQAATSASLAFTGDTIAQMLQRYQSLNHHQDGKLNFLCSHDWLRALRMASYGFLLYGPGSYAWYRLLDHYMPMKTAQTIAAKVILNQIILGPCVIAVVFAWNSMWQGKLSGLLPKYQKDALPTLLTGFKFWIPASIINFGVVPLQARVAFMSLCSIFWNFYLSTTMSK